MKNLRVSEKTSLELIQLKLLFAERGSDVKYNEIMEMAVHRLLLWKRKEGENDSEV